MIPDSVLSLPASNVSARPVCAASSCFLPPSLPPLPPAGVSPTFPTPSHSSAGCGVPNCSPCSCPSCLSQSLPWRRRQCLSDQAARQPAQACPSSTLATGDHRAAAARPGLTPDLVPQASFSLTSFIHPFIQSLPKE